MQYLTNLSWLLKMLLEICQLVAIISSLTDIVHLSRSSDHHMMLMMKLLMHIMISAVCVTHLDNFSSSWTIHKFINYETWPVTVGHLNTVCYSTLHFQVNFKIFSLEVLINEARHTSSFPWLNYIWEYTWWYEDFHIYPLIAGVRSLFKARWMMR